MIGEILALSVFVASPGAPPNLALARQFAEGFVKNPPSVRHLVAADAMVAAGDMGFPMADALKGPNPFNSCVIDTLEYNSQASARIMENNPSKSDQIAEVAAAFDGTMHCTPSRKGHVSKFRVVLLDNKVQLFQLLGRD